MCGTFVPADLVRIAVEAVWKSLAECVQEAVEGLESPHSPYTTRQWRRHLDCCLKDKHSHRPTNVHQIAILHRTHILPRMFTHQGTRRPCPRTKHGHARISGGSAMGAAREALAVCMTLTRFMARFHSFSLRHPWIVLCCNCVL